MKETINYDERAEQQMQILRQSIKARIEKRKEPIGKIEKAIGVSEGYFSRIWKKERTPDVFILCKLAEYFDIDYYLLFSKPLDMVDARELSDTQIINQFFVFLKNRTMEKRLIWEKRVNLVSGIVCSYGLKRGIYDVSYSAEAYSEENFKYRESRVCFRCHLEGGEKLALFEITSGHHLDYELLLNNDLLYATAGNEDNKEGNRSIRSLYQYLLENLSKEKKYQKWNCSLESMEIVKKYIKEDQANG